MPPAATDCIPFTHCCIQVAKLPVSLFETPQATKKTYAGQQRHELLVRLSGHADNDGTNCWPGDAILAEAMGCSQRQVRRLRVELKDLGFVQDDGYYHNPKNPERKNKKWKLVLPPAAQKALGLIDDLTEAPEVPAAEQVGAS